MLGTFSAMEVAASGLSAERSRMNTIASNLANAKTTRTDAGGPYKRIDPVFVAQALDPNSFDATERNVQRVVVSEIKEDTRDPMKVYEPGHPDADPTGYVSYPNVNVVEEMVNMISASRSYQNSVEVMNTARSLLLKTLQVGQ